MLLNLHHWELEWNIPIRWDKFVNDVDFGWKFSIIFHEFSDIFPIINDDNFKNFHWHHLWINPQNTREIEEKSEKREKKWGEKKKNIKWNEIFVQQRKQNNDEITWTKLFEIEMILPLHSLIYWKSEKNNFLNMWVDWILSEFRPILNAFNNLKIF